MISPFIPDILAIILFLITAFIAGRALYLYARIRSPRLFILGLSMGVIALTALADLISGHVTSVTLRTDWFLYIGQGVSFLFILLSLIKSDDTYQRNLMTWHIIFSVAVLLLLVFSPILPGFPNVAVQFALRSTRCIFCFAIFFYYMAAFMSKQSRFSLLMGTSFLLLSFGYLVIILQYVVVPANLFDNLGDLIRMVGLVTLLVAVVKG